MCALGFYSLKVKKYLTFKVLYRKMMHFQNIIILCMKCRMNGNKNFFCKYLSQSPPKKLNNKFSKFKKNTNGKFKVKIAVAGTF